MIADVHPSLASRFWAKVDRGPECWTWTAARTRQGYGLIHHHGRSGMVTAHRVAWTIANGPIPDGMHVLHSCDNPPCVNPAHLFLGTNADNVADRVAKGRPGGKPRPTHCIRGHELTEATTYRRRNGTRQCRACARLWALAHRKRAM